MYSRLDKAHRALPVILGVVTLSGAVLLIAGDLFPQIFPAANHNALAAASLALIAVAYLLYEVAHRPAPMGFLKAVLLAVAFLFWAANQLCTAARAATLCNDIAIALFVLDVFLVMAGWPAASPDGSFAETQVRAQSDTQLASKRPLCGCCRCACSPIQGF
jgi:uncharacterized membrane protein YoaT (DUF817 family)